MTRISFRCSEEFLARVDDERGDVPRETWVRGAVERALDGIFGPQKASSAPAPAEQPESLVARRPLSARQGPDVAAFRRATQK